MAEYTISKIKFGNNTYNLSAGSVSLPIASDTTLGGIKVGSGLSINSTTGVLSATGGGTADSVDWQNVTSKPTTISGYGITDASISNGTITLGSNSITPLTSAPVTSVNGQTGDASLNANDVDAFSLVGLTEIPANANLNSYLDVGNYYVGTSNASTITNSPTTNAFYLSVSKNNSNSTYIHQNLRTVYGALFYRCMRDTGTEYSSWVQTFPNKPTSGSLTIRSGYVTDGGSYVKKNADGLVVFKLNLTASQAISSGSSYYFITFPSGYRPNTGASFAGQADTTGTAKTFYLTGSNGRLYCSASIVSGANIRLSGAFYNGE